MELMPHQQHVFDVGLELDENGRFVYSEVDVTVPRQSGKTTQTFVKKVWRCTVAAKMWGPQRTAYTAQNRLMARRKLERDFTDLLRGAPRGSFREVEHQRQVPRRPNEWRLSLNNGSEHLRIGRSYLGIDAPTRTAGHGDPLDDGDIDEAFAHQDDEVEQAMVPATATRFNPQIWVQSTAGDRDSFYLWRKVREGRKLAGGPVAYFEWSVPEDEPFDDPAVWREYLPALGRTISEAFLERELAKARRRGDESLFRRAFCNQWVEIPVLPEDVSLGSVWPDGAWDACCHRAAASDVGVVFCVDVHPDRVSAAIGVADAAGRVELVEHQSGVGWTVGRAVELAKKYRASVAVQSTGAAGGLIPDLEREHVNVIPIPAGDVRRACGKFYDTVTARAPFIRSDPRLDVAAASAVKKPSGDGWVFDRRATTDITPLYAVLLARWAAAATPKVPLGAWR